MTEQAPGRQHDTQRGIQDAVARVTDRHSGEDVDVITEALSRALADVGVGPQPEKWLRDTASEIAEGRHVVVDRTLDSGAGGNDQ